MSSIKHPELAGLGRQKIDWVRGFMPVLSAFARRYSVEKPLSGLRVAVSVHMEAKTAYLCKVLRACGAEVHATGCNPLSTKDEIAAALDAEGIDVHGWFNASEEEYRRHIAAALSCRPHILIDDGGDFVSLLHGEHPEFGENLIGGCEETTTGIHRLKARAAAGLLKFPMIAVNDADSKHLFDNHHGTGQSTWDAIMYTTNVMLSGATVVVAGYGNCGSRGGSDNSADCRSHEIIANSLTSVEYLPVVLIILIADYTRTNYCAHYRADYYSRYAEMPRRVDHIDRIIPAIAVKVLRPGVVGVA